VRVLAEVEGRADGHLDFLGTALAQEQRVFLFDVGDDRVVQLVARDANRLGGDDTAERDHGHLGRAAADVDDHVAGRLVHGQARADRGGHGFLDDVYAARAGLAGRLDHGTAFDAGDARGNADHHARTGEVAAAVHLENEVAQHSLGDLEVGDDAVLEGANGDDVAGRAPDHLLRLGPHREDASGGGVLGDHRRLVEHDAAASHVHQRVGRTEVDRHVTTDERQVVRHKN
jgi:hypothetical protein